MSIDQSLFRQVMGHFATGVTVVTTAYEGDLSGITVSSFTSLSLEPLLILVCIDRKTASHDTLARSGMFAVNILNEDQEYLSRRFATRDTDKFVSGSFVISEHGLPLLKGVLATVECRIANALPGGDHTIYIGEVIAAHVGKGRPLVYFRSGYYQLG